MKKKRKNENFNLLTDRTKKNTYTKFSIRADHKRNDSLKDDDNLKEFIKRHGIPKQTHCMVYSPMMFLSSGQTDNGSGLTLFNGRNLPGNAGDWTDDDESFIILFNKNNDWIYILNYDTRKVIYAAKVGYNDTKDQFKLIVETNEGNSYNATILDSFFFEKWVLGKIHSGMGCAVSEIVSQYSK